MWSSTAYAQAPDGPRLDTCAAELESYLESSFDVNDLESSYVFLVSGESHRQRVPLAAGECVGFLGFAEPPLADLDLILYAENGRRLRADVEPDGQPYVRHCASEESRVWLEMRSYRGTGRAAVMRFTGAPESLPELGLRVGGCFAGEASERTPRLEVGPDPRFPMRARAPEALPEGGRAPEGVLPEAYHALYATWEARGWAPRLVDWVALPQGGFVDVPVVLASADGACEAWGVAISSEARGAQVDLALRDERGRWVAWNLRSQSWATLYHCLEGRQRGVLRVRLRGGSGRVWLSRGE